ncbi:hypothetical protein SAMN05444955_102222 [Lihuaxuella thermophila]|uniref:Uncharacterized protein n=1 Tax=Lihuaxuella thermophila TaxID=1173111 RepID=A0A1H8BJG8_9BACL|nr:hypothetical protein SAMN05444955_102222 [Lihuaxuella thermophila]
MISERGSYVPAPHFLPAFTIHHAHFSDGDKQRLKEIQLLRLTKSANCIEADFHSIVCDLPSRFSVKAADPNRMKRVFRSTSGNSLLEEPMLTR